MSYVEWEKDIQHLELSEISEFKPMPPIMHILSYSNEISFDATNIPTDIQFLVFQTAVLLFHPLSLPT
jgi:hypothetical protein